MTLKTINDLTALTTPASTDLLGVWAVGAARMQKSTIDQVVAQCTNAALLAGRSGGQTLIGGTGSGDDLTLISTTHATKGDIILSGPAIVSTLRPAANSTTALQLQNAAGTAAVTVDTTNNRLGIGSTPGGKLHIGDGTAAFYGAFSVLDGSNSWGYFYRSTGASTPALGNNAASLLLLTTRGTHPSRTSLQDGDAMGELSFGGYAGSGTWVVTGAKIGAIIDGTVTPTALPGTLVFETNGTIRMRVNSAGNVKIAGSAVRSTTEGTNHIDIYNGTAPVGTLANGISIYSSGGECYIMDAAGNATLQSPHDDDGKWIFYSQNTVTGRKVRVDMEQMLRALNEFHGWNYFHEEQ